MCARYAFFSGKIIQDQFGLTAIPDIEAHYNLAPTDIVPAVIKVGPQRHLEFFSWGLIPSWAKDASGASRLINARSETAFEKPSFRSAFKYRRCLIPADGFYEWQGEKDQKQAYFIHRPDRQPMAFAGLWEEWKSAGEVRRTCTILTCAPNDLMAEIHDRMPVILAPSDFEPWLETPEEERMSLMPLLTACPSELLELTPVSRAVGNPRNEGPELIERIPPKTLFD